MQTSETLIRLEKAESSLGPGPFHLFHHVRLFSFSGNLYTQRTTISSFLGITHVSEKIWKYTQYRHMHV